MKPCNSELGKTTVETIGVALLVGFVVWLFFLMISNIDFKGMSFSQIKLVVSICAGVAVSIINKRAGGKFVESAVTGFVVSVFAFAVIQIVIQMLFNSK
ncbi:MAG: hypothetical protein Q7T57_03675 [Dehalococcoidales bacterium]|nr:hypothetical protein [Dehalococcoidales bacterium]